MVVDMDAWPRFERAALARHGVADVGLARRHGVARGRFFARTAREAWGRPRPGVRVHPETRDSVQRRVVIVCSSTQNLAAAAGETAAWLHQIRGTPPEHLTIVVGHSARRSPYLGVTARRARWLGTSDVVEVDGVAVLAAPAMLLSSLGAPVAQQRRRLIDVVHRRLTTPDAVLDRLDRVGPATGKHVLRELCEDLVDRRVESIFQEEVADDLGRLGYRPERSTRRVPRADGGFVEFDVPLPVWKVAVEPDGDAFHRTREQRRRDRRRDAAIAGTDWVRVPVDWRDWHLERGVVLGAVDAAIEAQRARGIGADVTPPRR